MKRILIATLLATVIPACHRGPASEVIIVDPPPPTPAPTPPGVTQVLFEATNYDYFDYALWIEWREPDGTWSMTNLFQVWSATGDGPDTNWGVVGLTPGSYQILLADPWGNVWDSYSLTVPTAEWADVSFDIVDGYLLRTS